MAKQLKIDLESQDLNTAIEGAKKLNLALLEVIKTEKKLLTQTKKVTQAIDLNKNLAKGIKDVETAQKKLAASQKNIATAEKAQIVNKREQIKLEIDLERKIQAKTRTSIQARREEERQVKASQKLKAAADKVSGAYGRLRKELNRQEKEFKDLIITEGRATKQTEKLRLSIKKMRGSVDSANQQVGRFNDNVGNYKSALAGSLGTVGQFATGAGAIAAGVLLAGKAIGSGITIIKEYEQANANLQAVLGVTKSEMGGLIDQSKSLGATTSFSASEVAGLQTEFAKLGFPTRDIQLMAESTLNAANAMGSDLGEQAALTGSTLKAFGLDASEAVRVNDVLSKATSASALDFQKLAGSMSTIAPVAASFGFSLEGTTALLGELSNAGFDASSAATSTRNILLNLADANGELAKKLGEPVKDLPSLVAGLKKLEAQGVNLGEALELTDKRSVAAFSTFLKGTDSVLALNDTLLQAGGTAEEMANVQLDTLDGSLKILNSSWEGFVLSVGDSTGATNAMTISVDVLSSILSTLSGEVQEVQKSQSELNDETIETLELSQKNAKENTNLADRYEELSAKESLNGDEKRELNRITTDLIGKFGESVSIINQETGALEINIAAVRKKILADRILSSEATKTLLTEKARLENQIELAAQSEKTLSTLRESFAGNFRITKLIDAAKKGTLEYARALQDIRLDFSKTGADATEFNNQLGAVEGTLKRNAAAVLDLGMNQEELNKINQTFLDLGIDINEFLEEETANVTSSTGAKKEESKATRELTGLIEKQAEAIKVLNEEKQQTTSEDEIARLTGEIEIAQAELERLQKLGETAEDDGAKEAAFNLAEFRKELAIQEEEDFEQRVQNEIALVNFRAEEELKTENLLADEIKLIREKREADINAIVKKADEDRAKLREEEKENILSNSVAIATFLTNLEKAANKRKIDALDSEIEAITEQKKALRQAAIDGVADAEDNIAIAEQLEAEARERKKQELKKQKREELGLVYLKLVATHAEAGDKNPVLAATTDLIKTQAFIAALQGFHGGTDDTGNSGVMKDEHGVITGYTHKNEAVYSEKDRAEMDNAPRHKVIENYKLAERMKAGDFERAHEELTVVNQYRSNEGTIKAVENLQKAVEKNKPPTLVPQFDQYSKAMIEIIKQQGRTDKYITAVGGGGIMGID